MVLHNGEPVTLKRAQNGFTEMKRKGEGNVVSTFHFPNGLKEGGIAEAVHEKRPFLR